MYPEKYTVTWHSHQDYLREMMRGMMTSEDFTDVTLVTDDKKTLKAHRNILSACSPVFKNILQMEINKSHPVIYLRGIQHSEIESILQYIYLGEAKFHGERVNEFLSVSKNLEIQELSIDVEIDKSQIETSNQNQEYVTKAENVKHNNITEVKQDYILESNEEESISKEIIKLGSKFQCSQCDKLFSHNKVVDRHIRSVHEGVKYACNQCDHQATQQGSLRKHIQSVHEGVKHACNQCHYQATEQGSLRKHIQSVHEGVKYACNQCDYEAANKSNLTRHIQSIHRGVKYACNQCDYQTGWKGDLASHTKKLHL